MPVTVSTTPTQQSLVSQSTTFTVTPPAGVATDDIVFVVHANDTVAEYIRTDDAGNTHDGDLFTALTGTGITAVATAPTGSYKTIGTDSSLSVIYRKRVAGDPASYTFL